MALPRPNHLFSTTLAQAADDSQTTLALNALPPIVPCILTLEPKTEKEEKVKVTDSGGGQITVVRGYGGTTPTDHNIGATIADYNAGEYIDELADVIEVEHNDDGTHNIPGMVTTGDIAGMVTEDGVQTLTNKTLTSPTINNPTMKAPHEAWVDAVDGATVTFDLSNGNKQRVTLGGNRTLALSNVQNGHVFLLRLKQDATGGRTPTWFSGITWVDGAAPTLTTTPNKADVFGFIQTGANTYDGFVVGQNL